MTVSKDERARILRLVEDGQVTALQAAQLLDALETDTERPSEPGRDRILRVHMTTLNPRLPKVNVAATLPVSLIRASLRLGTQLFPQLGNGALEDLLRTIDSRATGRLLDLQDLDRGERLEIFVE
ncbi:MAG: hypothetical protein JO011_05175 [Ktedonobacteraceae bacterium]|nr:hypothetical protein [Ktedonobacteraceae bacterium]